MAYGRSPSSSSSIFEVFSLNPVPYPVLLILAVIFLFLGLQWYVSYEDIVEAAEESMGWLLMAAPLVLLFAVRWLSAWENPGGLFFGSSPYYRQRRGYYLTSATEGSSPWGVLALIVLLLVLVQFQSSIRESWFVWLPYTKSFPFFFFFFFFLETRSRCLRCWWDSLTRSRSIDCSTN